MALNYRGAGSNRPIMQTPGSCLGDGLAFKRVATSKSRPYIRVIWPLWVIWGYRGHLKTTKLYHRTTTHDARTNKRTYMLCKAKSPNMVAQLQLYLCKLHPIAFVSTETSKQKLEPSIRACLSHSGLGFHRKAS